MATNPDLVECVVVGGGAAGLSAALVLGRARVRTVVVDSGTQANLPAHGIGGLLGHNGRPPHELYAMGRAEIAEHPSVEVVDDRVLDARADGDGFVVDLASGRTVRTERLLLATGMRYVIPELDGVRERWGRTVFHCPFCHGWEVRDLPLVVLDSGPTAVHRAQLLSRWSDDVTVIAATPFTDEESVALAKAGAKVVVAEVDRLLGDAPALTAVRLVDGTEVPCGGILIASRLEQTTDLAQRLGAATTETMLADAMVVTDPMGATSVPGLFAAGDTAMPMPSVANAIAAGSNAAAGVVRSLLI